MRGEEEQADSDWTENEMGLVQLGDQRLTSRLVTLARSLARAPDLPLPQALPQWRDLKAAYRFFDNAKAVPEHILAGHINATWSRNRAAPIVLAVQDTTYLNWECDWRQGKHQMAGKRRSAECGARGGPANDLCQGRRPGRGCV